MLTIKSNKSSFGIKFPTDVSEVTADVLNEITKNVKLPKHYCIIAMCYKTKVFDFVASLKKNAGPTIQMTPLLAKVNADDIADNNPDLKIGDRVIVERASIERGTHLHLPTMVSVTNAGKYFAKDQELISAIMRGQYDYGNELITKPEIVILEFKILPVGEIHAAIEPTAIAVDPFRVNAAAN